MNIVKCKNGHFYDADKTKLCPHCPEELICVLPSMEMHNLKLLRINDEVQITEIEFGTEDVLAGRDYNVCKLVLKNEYAARQQAKFIFNNGYWYIMDLNSMNGTYVNGNRLESNKLYELKCNDLISFANRENYIFVMETLTSRLIVGPTPNGAYAIEFFYDKNGNACYEKLAHSAHIHEYDRNGKFVFETMGYLDSIDKTEQIYNKPYPHNKTSNFEDAITIYASPDIMSDEKNRDDYRDAVIIYSSPDIM